jgi:Protein of unknown function (DUF1254)
VQVPDFGDRFWVYQIVDQRTDGFAQIGKMYATTPGFLSLGRSGLARRAPEGDYQGLQMFDQYGTCRSASFPG